MKTRIRAENNSEAQLDESIAYIKKEINSFKPRTGIILGTGLGGVVKEVDVRYNLDYSNIPNFPVSTVESHHGRLIFGFIAAHPLIIMQGRFHYYEGYSMRSITYPLNIMKRLGVSNLLVSNACGAVNPLYRKGDLMVMRDHINFLFDSPLIAASHLNSFSKKTYSNPCIYDRYLIKIAEKTARENKISLQKGVYCTFQGPNLETKSEYRFARKIGADVVGMSTIPETLVSKRHDFRILGFSIVTDVGLPGSLKPVVLEDVLKVASEAEPRLTLLMKKIIEKLD